MGCLTAPLKLLGLLLFIALLLLGWLYRDRLGAMAGAAWREARGRPAAAIAVGIPSEDALSDARRKIARLSTSRTDSVVLTPAEAASLLREGLDQYARSLFDSMQVQLGEDVVGITATVRTDRLPAGILGPFGSAVRDREPVTASGPIRMAAPGRGEWEVRRFEFRSIPLPGDAVPRLLGRAMGDTARRTVPVQFPAGVAHIRVHPAGVTLFGAPQ